MYLLVFNPMKLAPHQILTYFWLIKFNPHFSLPTHCHETWYGNIPLLPHQETIDIIWNIVLCQEHVFTYNMFLLFYFLFISFVRKICFQFEEGIICFTTHMLNVSSVSEAFNFKHYWAFIACEVEIVNSNI